VQEQPDKINKEAVKKVVDETCPAWEEYVKNNPIDQFDSGLKVRGLDLKRRSMMKTI
jgi:hypothetical protein